MTHDECGADELVKNARPDDPNEETLDRLAGDWWIWQLRRGHRYSTDDVLLAWTGLQAKPDASRVLDLGAGVGSVGLMSLLRLGAEATLTSVEVQEVSAALLRKTVEHNALSARVTVVRQDLREFTASPEPYDLILANPPYLPPGNALRSPHPQRAAARMELHGDVFDYCRVAASQLAESGRFCLSHGANDPRPEQAIAESGLKLLARREILFHADQKPTIAIFVCGRTGAKEPSQAIVVRDGNGNRTDEYTQVRRDMWIDA